MKKHKKTLLGIVLISTLFIGFQCASTEITSAKLYIQQKNYVKAAEVLQKEIQKNPKSDQGYYLLGYVNYEKGNFEEMLKNFEKSLSISKVYEKEIRDMKRSAWVNTFNRGVAFFQRAIKAEDEDSAEVLFQKAISDFNSATIIQPDSADAYKNLAFTYLSKGDNQSAIKPLEKLIELEQSNEGYQYLGEIYFVIGTNLKNEGKDDQSVEYFNKAIDVLSEGRKIYPDDPKILLYLSNAYIGANRTKEAMAEFKAGVESQPENKNYRYNYGVLLLGESNFEEAEKQFKKAIEIDPEYSSALYNLGITYLKWGAYLNKKAEEENKFTDEHKEKYRAALPYLEKVVQYPDADANSWELLGRVYSLLGMTNDANNAFKKADELRK